MNYSFAVQRVTCCHRRRGQAVGCLVRRAPSRSRFGGFRTCAGAYRRLDNDGTLLAEQPMYFQLLFALDRVEVPALQHPEWS